MANHTNEQSQNELRSVIADVCGKIGFSLAELGGTLNIDNTRLEKRAGGFRH